MHVVNFCEGIRVYKFDDLDPNQIEKTFWELIPLITSFVFFAKVEPYYFLCRRDYSPGCYGVEEATEMLDGRADSAKTVSFQRNE